jgi:hypothetical protein
VGRRRQQEALADNLRKLLDGHTKAAGRALLDGYIEEARDALEADEPAQVLFHRGALGVLRKLMKNVFS